MADVQGIISGVKQLSIKEPATTAAVSSSPVPPLAPEIPSDPNGDGIPFRILVVAFTHKAIDNLLSKLAHLSAIFSSNSKNSKSLAIGRLINKTKKSDDDDEGDDEDEGDDDEADGDSENSRSSDPSSVKPVEIQQIVASSKAPMRFLDKNPQCIIGGTTWAVRKAFNGIIDRISEGVGFDLIVIDEASQMMVMDICNVVRYASCSSTNGGSQGEDDGGVRVVLAGDHHQLPPISNGEYPVI